MGWFTLHCKTKMEETAERGLVEQGYEVYRPETINIKTKKIECMLPGYIFVAANLDLISGRISGIKGTKGVIRMVKFGEAYPRPIRDAVINQLRATEHFYKNALTTGQFEKGEKVRFMAGPFFGLNAVFEQGDGEGRAVVFMRFMDGMRRIDVFECELEKAG